MRLFATRTLGSWDSLTPARTWPSSFCKKHSSFFLKSALTVNQCCVDLRSSQQLAWKTRSDLPRRNLQSMRPHRRWAVPEMGSISSLSCPSRHWHGSERSHGSSLLCRSRTQNNQRRTCHVMASLDSLRYSAWDMCESRICQHRRSRMAFPIRLCVCSGGAASSRCLVLS
jgi:hypothetical protein